jgi:CRP/FNR family transcriptional regulator
MAGVCSALTAAQLMELSKHSSRRTIDAGSEFIGQGESVSSYSNILRGVVKLSKVMADGRQQIVGLQFAPDFMGRLFSSKVAWQLKRRPTPKSASSRAGPSSG